VARRVGIASAVVLAVGAVVLAVAGMRSVPVVSGPIGDPQADVADHLGPEVRAMVRALSGGASPGSGDQLLERLAREMDERVGECMREKGFEYPPGLIVAEVRERKAAAYFVDDEGRTVPDPGFVAAYGYGIVAANLSLQGVEMGGRIPDDPPSPYDELEGLSAGEREAFMAALQGNVADPSLPSGADGCYGRAEQETMFGRVREAVSAVRIDYADEIADRMQSDPRLNDLQERWQRCMAERGFHFRWTPEILDDLWMRLRELDEADADFAAYRDLLDHEVRVATADLLKCGGGPLADRVYREVQAEIELGVLEEHASRYAALLEG